jgi:hypothetical protein
MSSCNGKTITQRAAEGPLAKATLYNALNDGRLKAKKFGRRTIILDSDWSNFLESLPEYTPGRKVA